MAVASLRFDHSINVEETRGGVFIYDGTPSRLNEWIFRATMRIKSAEAKDKPKMMNMVIEGLRGEAASVSMDLGMEELLGEKGIDTLTQAMTKHVFPKAEAEAKEALDARQNGTVSTIDYFWTDYDREGSGYFKGGGAYWFQCPLDDRADQPMLWSSAVHVRRGEAAGRLIEVLYRPIAAAWTAR